jgi:SH3 domain-containing YSC84-like protein 1
MNRCVFFLAGFFLVAPAAAAAPRPAAGGAPQNELQKDEKARLTEAGVTLKEVLEMPENIPQELLDKARCVIVMPSVLKAAIIVGGSWGRGAMVCRTGRDFSGPWGAPAMYALEGGSIGYQFGGEAIDFVILVMNDRGLDSLLNSKIKLGAGASIAAGPVGRTASADTDAFMRAELLSYSRSRGIFAGISLEGASLRPDDEANRRLYGNDASTRTVIAKPMADAPEAGKLLVSRLQEATPQLKP